MNEPTYTAADLAKARADERLVVTEVAASHVPWDYGMCSCGVKWTNGSSPHPSADWSRHIREALSTHDTEAARQAIVADAVAKAWNEALSATNANNCRDGILYAMRERNIAVVPPQGERAQRPNPYITCLLTPSLAEVLNNPRYQEESTRMAREIGEAARCEGERASASPGEGEKPSE